MNRKLFIKNSAIASALYPFLNALASCNSNTVSQNRILVLIQLVGGNDGLNTLIPLDNYKRITQARPNLFIPENKVLGLKGSALTGLHPALEGVKDLYDNNLLSFIQGVGYENQNYSHFRSSDIYLTGAESSKVLYTGWMARFLETRYNNYPKGFPSATHPDPPAIKVGDTGSFLFQGKAMDMSIVVDPSAEFTAPEIDAPSNKSTGYAGEEIKSIREILLQTERYSKVIQNALDTTVVHSTLYPEAGKNSLADQLKTVAKLIKGGLQTSVYLVDLKGFDTHSEQVDSSDTTKGSHADLLHKLSQAITCFWDDMNKIGREKDVTGITFSEFGRRIISNSAYGTDHGASQPLMVFGSHIKPGITGTNPLIPDKLTANDNLQMQFDFKDVYSSVLKNWFQATPEVVQSALPGTHRDIELFKS